MKLNSTRPQSGPLRSVLKLLIALQLSSLICLPAFSQKQVERLGRGVVAVRTDASSVYVSWRLLGTDPSGIAFNVYRGSTKINSTPITASTNIVDNTTTNSTYTVRPVVSGTEQAASAGASVWSQQFLEVAIQRPAGGTTPDGVAYTYSPNDCSPGDLDGDGEYEIVVKWDPSNAKDNSQAGYTGNVFIDAYKLNGTRLWRIDLGRNIRAGAHYTQLMVYDLDGDGKAEVACKTADGTRSGTGQVIGNASADFRASNGYILTGPEFLTVFNGQTGAILATTNYQPPRGNVCSWGNNECYGNRVDRFVSTIAYLDGQRPSLIMGRGYYDRLVRAAYDYRGGQLTLRWLFDSKAAGNNAYSGQGNHQLTVGDVDGDGKDEVVNGASAINDNGTGQYANGLGHGDALHMTDMDPDRPGQEVWQCHEDPGSYGNYGLEFRDARTGAPIWGVPGGGDVGRAMAADIDPRYKGYEVWGSVGGLYTCKGVQISTTKPSVNFGLWWDGDLQREILDGTKLDKWNSSNNTIGRLFTFNNFGTATSINGTKANPNLSADILGDWREEAIYHSSDNSKLLIFTTTITAANRFYTFMHDPQYRCQVAQQTSAYNQPPHPSFYFGGGMAAPPTPNIFLAGATPPANPGTLSGTFVITARHSGKSLDVAGSSTANGGDVIQSTTASSDNNQKWTLTYLGAGYYRISNLQNNKALDVDGASTANGGNILQWDWTGAFSQHWQINDLGNGYYSIINRNSSKAVDVEGASTAEGADVLQWTYSGNNNQQFILSPVDDAATSARVSPQDATLGQEDWQTTIFPNPSAGAFTIKAADRFTYRIFNQLGKELEKGQGQNQIATGKNLVSGVYFIAITKNGVTQTIKFVKQ